MALSNGTRLGPYEILAPLGAGGMGEVYRARDTRLDRTVAVKILPAHLSDKPAAKERFEREARAISSLSHPHICHLYDVGSHGGVNYLVMEYLEGETLAERLRKGPLTLDQVVRYGIDICEGLETAHRSGIVHRDLKPGNIMLTKSGAKLMDFGLARPTVTAIDAALSSMKTLAEPLTAEGTVVGTFQYMSPEQVEGRDVAGPSDLFSLGAVLYEMVTGRRAFEGKSQLSVASAILEKEPEPIAAIKPLTPPALEHAIRTCLQKDPEKRWQSGRDLAHALAWIANDASPAGGRADARAGAGAREWLIRAALVLLAGVAAAALALGLFGRGGVAVEARVVRSWIKPAPETSFLVSDGSGFALSPDGRLLAYVASATDGKSAIWVRPIDSLEARRLAGTEGAQYPFWSPDSRSLGFFAAGKLKSIDASGANMLTLCEAPDGRGGTWNRHGDILFAPSVNTSIYRVGSTGGSTVAVTSMDAARGQISHRWPWFLPDGRHFLYLGGSVFTSTESPTNTIHVGSLDSKETRVLLKTHAGAVYASGQILYLRQNTLMAQPFDTNRLELVGSPAAVADPVQEAELFAKGLFSASDNGLLTYLQLESRANRQLVWYDRSGAKVDIVPGTDAYASVRISPDGKRLLYYLDSGGFDVWTYDLARSVKVPQTFGSSLAEGNIFPVWSPDGGRIAYTHHRDGRYSLNLKAADGSSTSETVLDGVERYRFVSDWSPDGRTLAYHEGAQEGHALWMLPLDGDRRPYRFMESPFSTREAVFSPDGRWVSYVSNESGAYRVYVAPFPGPGGKWQVSPAEATCPRWRRDGRELFFMSVDEKIMAVDITPHETTLEVGPPRLLCETRAYGVFGRFDVTSDGRRFIVPYEAGSPSTALALVAGWDADLNRRDAR